MGALARSLYSQPAPANVLTEHLGWGLIQFQARMMAARPIADRSFWASRSYRDSSAKQWVLHVLPPRDVPIAGAQAFILALCGSVALHLGAVDGKLCRDRPACSHLPKMRWQMRRRDQRRWRLRTDLARPYSTGTSRHRQPTLKKMQKTGNGLAVINTQLAGLAVWQMGFKRSLRMVRQPKQRLICYSSPPSSNYRQRTQQFQSHVWVANLGTKHWKAKSAPSYQRQHDVADSLAWQEGIRYRSDPNPEN
jgi:hypothetical protein